MKPMDTRRMWPEILVGGFLHLVWLSLLTFLLCGIEPGAILCFFKDLPAGAGAVITSLSIGASFLLGNLFNRLLTDLSALFKKPTHESKLLDAFQKNPAATESLEARWATKVMFRSTSASIPLIVAFLLPWACDSPDKKAATAVLVVGILLEVLFLIAFFTQRNSHAKLLEEMKGDSNK